MPQELPCHINSCAALGSCAMMGICVTLENCVTLPNLGFWATWVVVSYGVASPHLEAVPHWIVVPQ